MAEEKNKEKSKAAPKAPKKRRFNPAKYFRDLRAEFKKIVWPTRKVLIRNTSVTIAAMGVIGAVIWVFDGVFTFLVGLLRSI